MTFRKQRWEGERGETALCYEGGGEEKEDKRPPGSIRRKAKL